MWLTITSQVGLCAEIKQRGVVQQHGGLQPFPSNFLREQGPLHVRSVRVHGPAWDVENRQFQLDWQNFRLLERLVTGELALIKEALLQVVDEVIFLSPLGP